MTALAQPAVSMAAGADISGDAIRFRAGVGEVNEVTISPGEIVQGGGARVRAFEVADLGAPVTAGPGCVAKATSVVACPARGIRSIVMWGYDGDDKLVNDTATASSMYGGDGEDEVVGGSGPDLVSGGRGADRLYGRDGDDQIATRGNFADIVDCGAGTDSVWTDWRDGVAANCESIFTDGAPTPRGTDPGDGGATAGGTIGTTPAPATLTPGTTTTSSGCRIRLARLPKARKATVAGVGRVTLSATRLSHRRVRIRLRGATRRLAEVAFKLDGRTLKGRTTRPMTRSLRVTSLKPGRHAVKAIVTPQHGSTRRLRLVLNVRGC